MLCIVQLVALGICYYTKTLSFRRRLQEVSLIGGVGGGDADLKEAMSVAIRQATKNEAFKGDKLEGGYGSGGGGATTGLIIDSTSKQEYFYKSTSLFGYAMLQAEFAGIKEMYETKTIKVPEPVAIGTSSHNAFVVFEKLSLGGYGSAETYAQKLAAMHSVSSSNGMFGWKMNNTCGATPQPNTYNKEWATFWDECRLGHMLSLCRRDGAVYKREKELRAKTHALLSEHSHSCALLPSLVHGDLWSGNQAFTKDGEPVIFDPAVYWGDAEVDIAMTKLFGSNSNSFYQAYNTVRPQKPGWQLRETVYNTYHILNHYVLFGGGYFDQACRMMDRVIDA